MARRADLNRRDLANLLTEILELPIVVEKRCPKAVQIVDIIIRTMTEALQNGESVKIPGLGTFSVRFRRKAVPQLRYFFGEKTMKVKGPIIFPSKFVHFRAHRSLRFLE